VRSDGSPATHQLCIHYDPDTLPLVRIRELVEAAGARITEQFGHLVWNIEGITHQRRARTVSEQLLNLPGVLEAEVSVGGVVRLEFDRQQTSEDDIRAVLAGAGVDRKFETHRHEADDDGHRSSEDDGHRHGGIFGANSELIFSLVCGGLLAIGFAIEKLTPMPGWLPLVSYLGAYFFGGFYTVREAAQNL